MFDVGFSELVLLAVVALVVLGPEKLPHAARMTGAWLGRIRRTVLGIQAEIEKEVAAAEMRDRIQKEMERLKATEVSINQELNAVENTIRQAAREPDDAPPVPEAPAADMSPSLPAPVDSAVPEAPAPAPTPDRTPAAP